MGQSQIFAASLDFDHEFTNIKYLKVSSFNDVLLSVIMLEPELKNLSTVTDEAGMAKISLAIFDRFGIIEEFSFHQVRILMFKSGYGIFKYLNISSFQLGTF